MLRHVAELHAVVREHRVDSVRDRLDQSFQELYPNYTWISETVLRIGQHSVSGWALTELAISNSSGEQLTYLLPETNDIEQERVMWQTMARLCVGDSS
jgi:hypothetical protein